MRAAGGGTRAPGMGATRAAKIAISALALPAFSRGREILVFAPAAASSASKKKIVAAA